MKDVNFPSVVKVITLQSDSENFSISRLPEFVRTDVAATILGVSANTLYKWHSQKTGPIAPIKIGGRLRWSRQHISNLLGGGEK